MVGLRGGGGGQGGCELRSEAFVKIQKKKKNYFLGGGGFRFGGVGGCQGGSEWRSKAFVKIQKKILFLGGGGGGGGVRVDGNREVKLV